MFPVMYKVCQLTGQRIAGYSMAAMGSKSVDDYWKTLERRERRDRLCKKFLVELHANRFDGILCPPDALPALPHKASQSVGVGLSYCALYNLLGMPAGVVAATRVQPDEETDRPLAKDRVEVVAKEPNKTLKDFPSASR
jgi:fatty acid amide hydrolase